MLTKVNKLKREYYDWRTWNYNYRNMKKHINSKSINKIPSIPYLNKPGICFSFDDSFRVNDWCKYGKNLFGFYDVRATFNINAYHHYEGNREHNQAEIDMLLELQSDGHEMAHHGYNHKNAVEYSDQWGLKKWFEDEIEPLFKWIEKQSHSKTGEKFKKPVTFTFPYYEYNKQILEKLIPEYFKIARGISTLKDFLTPKNHSGFAPSICIDSHHLTNSRNMTKIMKLAKQTGCNLILNCHSIIPDDVNWLESGWQEEHSRRLRTSPKVIQSIINTAKENELGFYTTAELAGIATFSDRNFEKGVRNLLNKLSDQWLFISDLSSITELDISNQSISNLDGIQYFVNLEKLNISNTMITDVRLLQKLPNLISVDVIK